MRIGLLLACILALVTANMAGAGAPSFFGYTGLIITPTADALSTGEYTIGAIGLNMESGADSNVYSANFGLAEAFEVGFARVKPKRSDGETWLNAKYRFQAETAAQPAFAAGVFDLTDEVGSTTYIVMSKSIAWRGDTPQGEITAPRIHVGVGGGQLDGLFGAVSAALGDRLLLMAEYDSRDINVGARLAVTNEFRLHAGFLHDFDDFGVGISFNRLR